MGLKDHLSTPTDDNKRRNRDIKKVVSVAYQGSPPVFTEGLDQVGLKVRTTGEVRDTDFPLLFNIDDQAQGFNLDTYNLDLSNQEAMYHRIIIGDVDEAVAPILNVDVFFNNLPKNKELQFTIEFVKDPAIVTDPTVTFSPPLENVPAGFPDDFPVWYFLISARTLPDNTTRFQLLNFGTGGGGGNSFPILYPEENLGSIGSLTQIITISGSDGQFKEFEMTGDIDLAFAGAPAGTVLEEFWLLVNQDGVGGHNLTATGTTLKNKGILNSLLDKTALAQTLFHFVTGDGGATFHADLVDLVAGGGGGFSGNLSDLVIDVSKDWNAKNITNLGFLDLFSNLAAQGIFNMSQATFISNAGASRGQFGRSDEFGTAQGMALNIMAGDNFVVAVDTNEKFRVDSALGQVRLDYDLHMKGNTIILDADGDTTIESDTDDEMDFRTGGSVRMQLANVGLAITVPTTSIIGDVQIFGGTFKMFSGQISAGGAGVGMDNIGNLVFVSNLATPAAGVAIYSDGTFLKAKSNSLTGNIMLNPQIEDLNMGLFNILSTQVPTVGNQFRIIFDGHADSNTFISNTPTANLIHIEADGMAIVDISPTGFLMGEPINMNGENITTVGNMDFGGGSASSGRIRLPAGGAGAIKWESVPAGFDGEMYYDNDFNWFVDVGGEYKYWIGGSERFRIDDDVECFIDIDLNNNDLKRVQAIGFNDAGGQINVDLNVMQFVTTSPSAIMRFTPQGNNTLDITEDGLEMSENIIMGNNNIVGLNQIEFNISGMIIRDGPSALTIEVGSFDTIDFLVNNVPSFQVNQNFCDFFEAFWDMTERTSFIANPPFGQRRVFVNQATGELSVITPTGSIISLESGGGGGGGDVTNAANVGIGTGLIFRDKIGSILNFKTLVGGLNITLNNNADNIVISASGAAASFYQTIQDEGSSEVQQPTLNFVGAGVAVNNDGGGNRTIVTIPGGGGGTTITDVILGSPPSPASFGFYLDVTEAVFGIFAFDDLAFALPTAKPGLPNISHTLTSPDFPTAPIGYTYTNFGFSLSLIVSLDAQPNPDKQFRINVTVNETEFAADANFAGSDIGTGFGGQFGIGTGVRMDQDLTLSVGDRIGAKIWISSGGAGLTLQDFVQWIFPTKMEVTARNIGINYFEIPALPFGDSNTMIGTIPAGQSFALSGSGTFVVYRVGGTSELGAVDNDFGGEQSIVNFSDRLGSNKNLSNNTRGRTSRSTDSPQTQFWHKYRVVT